MKAWYFLVVSIVFFTIMDLVDIWTTLLFLGSSFCHEANPFFAPFSNNHVLLAEAYFSAWFMAVGVAGYVHLIFSRLKTHWLFGITWYWLLWFWGVQHLLAAISNYILKMSGVCG